VSRVILLGRPSGERLDSIWRDACAAEPSYDHVGSTLRSDGALTTTELRLGTGRDDVARACAGLRAWVCHAGIGATVHPRSSPIRVGTTVVVAVPFGPFSVVVPNRIVDVVDEDRRYGFAYGTLPGHQERGEESFVVELRDDGAVVGTITVDAVPASTVARSTAPIVRQLQRRAMLRYLAAWRDHVRLG
jgi:uncharacterized protein (UPF0548 family)